MKYSAILLPLAPLVLSAPLADVASLKRDDHTTVTDELLFELALPQFQARRHARDPGMLDWSSDGCTSSPDNPFWFPFIDACQRHDFGYQNYRLQTRFTKAAKAEIDNLFKKDLYYQCQSVFAQTACERLADVYYAAVKNFGGGDATKREETDPSYEKAVEAYEKAVKEAQAAGLLPTLEY